MSKHSINIGNTSAELSLDEIYEAVAKNPTSGAKEKLQSTEDTLQQRGRRYGEFAEHAKISIRLKQIVDSNLDGKGVEPYMYESLYMIMHKIARILNGDPFYDDSWRDIAGYTELVVKELNRES